LPWLILAAALRVVAFGGGAVALPAIIVANLAVLQAFLATAQRSIEAAGGESGLSDLDTTERFRLTRAILWRIVPLMIAAVLALAAAGFTSVAPHLLSGIDGMAFDQVTALGKFWSAIVAALILLVLVGAGQNGGEVALFAAMREFARRWFWLGGAVLVLGVAYLVLGLGQEMMRTAIWNFWQTSDASQFVKNLVYFVFIFSFAMLRLWMTLLILTTGLKQSYVGDG
jgi:hypothetical protein